jgi:NADH-quinone oxidoreductase subunit A
VLGQYFAILVFVVFAVIIAVVMRVIGYVTGPREPNRSKLSAYECGFDGVGDALAPFDVRFYLVAILFIIFDLETAFLFPWAVALRDIGNLGFYAMMIFLFILIVGFIYEWRKGALQWE